MDETIEQALAQARAYWKWGREPKAQYLLHTLGSEVERLQAELDNALDEIESILDAS